MRKREKEEKSETRESEKERERDRGRQKWNKEANQKLFTQFETRLTRPVLFLIHLKFNG